MVVAMFLAHLIGDYILQWDRLALWKGRSVWGVVAHGTIVLLVTWLIAAFFDPAWWPWAVFIGLTHILVDALPLWLGKYVKPLTRFILDQSIHLSLTTVALCASGYLTLPALSAAGELWLKDHRLMTYLLGYAFISMPAWVVVEFVAYGLVRGPSAGFSPLSNKYVSILERGLMTTFVLLGQFLLVPLIAVPRLVVQGRQTLNSPRALPYVAELLVSLALAVAVGLWLRSL